MSKKEKVTEQPVQKEEKVITKYDRKMQKRKDQEEKERREQRITTIAGIVIVAALVCLVASFPIRTYLAVNETFVTVGGEKISKVEFDYNYNVVKNNYINQYGSYLSYFGLDTTQDFSNQMYSDTLTWEDFFQQMAVESIQKNKALMAEAKAAGFTYDTAEDYKEYEDSMKELAAEQGMSLKNYVKTMFGSYATMGRLADCVKESIVINAYYEQVADEKAPSEEEITSYYEENKDSYDSVDYRMSIVEAVLPTEPTELADTTEQTGTEGSTGTDGTTQETAYEPSEAEVAAAMEEAKEQADAQEASIAADGELQEGQTRNEVPGALREWLFDAARKAGDTTVIEDENNNRYYVAAFENRFRDESPSADVRVIITTTTDGQTILDEWKSGEATEESFIELCKKYSEDTSSKEDGGLFEAVVGSGMEEVMSDWLYASERAAGDTTAITTEDGTNYVMYYVGKNEPEWKLSIKSTLLSETMTVYLEEITQNCEVEDKKGNLNYLKVEAEEAAAESAESTAAEESSAAEEGTSADGTESSETASTQAGE